MTVCNKMATDTQRRGDNYGRHVGLCIIMAHLVFLRVNKEALGAIYTSLKVSALSEGLRGIGEPRWPGILWVL